MIVYGTRSTLLKTGYISEQCPNCAKSDTIQMNIFQQYAHIFWIPFFPLRKSGVSVCANCRQVLKSGAMPASLKLSYDNFKTQTRPPAWHFAGVFLIVAGVIAGGITDKQKAEKVGKLILAPKKGDIFELKIKDSIYTLYKVQKVDGDTVYFFPNKFESDRESGLTDMINKGEQGFDMSMTYGLSKKAIINMNKNDEILDVDRN